MFFSLGSGSGVVVVVTKDNKQVRVLHHNSSGVSVSQALWPTEARRCISTGRAAQRRRNIIIQGRNRVYTTHTSSIYVSLMLISVSMLVGGSIVAALVLHQVYLLAIPTLVLAGISLMIVRPMYAKFSGPVSGPAFSLPNVKSFSGSSVGQRTSEMSVPVTPRIRELETFDLSGSNIEHFIKTGEMPVRKNVLDLPTYRRKERMSAV